MACTVINASVDKICYVIIMQFSHSALVYLVSHLRTKSSVIVVQAG